MADIFKVIFQLEADGQGVLKEINEVAGQYKKVNTELKNQEKELNALLKKEAEILAIRKKTNSPSEAAKLTQALKDNKASIEALKKSTTDLTNAEKELGKESERIGKKLDDAFKGTQVKSLRTQLKELKAQLAATEDDQEFLKLSIQAGKLEDKIGDAANAARIFATDSPFEAVGSAIGNVGQKLLALDFDGAYQGSQLLAKASGQITFKNALTGIKQLGGTLLNIGKALLTNPLFLIGAAIIGIIANFDKLKNSGGAIGTIFKGIGSIIQGAIDLFFSLTDAIGLTEHALSNLNESIRENAKLLLDQQQKVADRRIAIAKAAGLETDKLEKEQARKNIALLGVQLETYKRAGKLRADLTDEERKNAIELANEILDQGNKIKEIEAASNKKRLDNAKAYQNKVKESLLEEQNLRASFNKLLLDADKKNTEFFNKNRIEQGSNKQIELEFDLKRAIAKEEFAAREEDINKALAQAKKEGVLTKSLQEKYSEDRKKNAEKLEQDLVQLDEEKKLEIINNTQRLGQEKIDKEKQISEDILSQSTQSEDLIAVAKLNIEQKYYNDSIALLEKTIEKRKKANLDATEEEKKLQALKTKSPIVTNLGQQDIDKKNLSESIKRIDAIESHEEAALKLRNARRSTEMFAILKFEKQKLEMYRKSLGEQSEEFKNQQDKVNQIEKDALMQRRLENIAYTETIINAAISATNKILDAKVKEIDKQTELQQKRVDDAKSIAEDGNAELLQEEKARLDKLNKEKEKFVRQQQALATIELIANTAIAVSKAAAQGGVAAGITISAALIALIAGLASARSIASQAAFYEGGLYEGEGFTGNGNPRGESSKVGRKPYIYHNEEFIFNHNKTRKYKDIFQGVHEGRIDLREWSDKVKAFDSYNLKKERHQLSPIVHTTVEMNELKGQMEMLINIVKNQNTSISMDDNGFALHMKKVITRNDYIRNMAK